MLVPFHEPYAQPFIYFIEFKLDDTAEEALQQINEKHYAQPFEADTPKLFKIGVNLSTDTRNIKKWLVESRRNRAFYPNKYLSLPRS